MRSEVQRSTNTVSDYLARTDGLRSACARALQMKLEDLYWNPFVGWLIFKKPQWSSNTWALRKASVRCALELALEERPSDPDILAAQEALKLETAEGTKKNSTETSATKAKAFPTADRLRIFAALSLGRSTRARELKDWLRATCVAGLRPIEWRSAVLVPPERGYVAKMVVANAKAGNDRAHGELRTLRWRDLSRDTWEAISRTIAIAQTFSSDTEYNTYCRKLQELLHDYSHRLWPDRIEHFALYSCRHEAIASAKRIYAREEVAAIFGHATDDTCMSHYPRKKNGESRGGLDEVPIPDPDEVARVRLRADASLRRVAELADRDESSATQSAPNVDRDAAQEEATLDPFPTPPLKDERLEQERKRFGAKMWLDYSKQSKLGFDALDRSIEKKRDRSREQEPEEPHGPGFRTKLSKEE